jgi:uncharacterized SAM-binding protein YcdF (DUF218 family)
MPVTVSLGLILLALVLLRNGRHRAMAGTLSLAFLILWVASMPLVASALYRQLESRFPPRPLTEIPQTDCIVLLGGAVAPAVPPRSDIELSSGIDRVYKTAQLYRAGKGRVVVVSAGNQPWAQSQRSEADLTRELLVEWGVEESAVIVEGSSRNTRENAVFSKHAIDAIGCNEALLVTSAAHMPRAVAAFQAVGVSVIPVSTDVQVTREGSLALMAFLPSAGALAMTSEALREYLGMWFYRTQGWN